VRLFLNANPRMVSYKHLVSYAMHKTIQGKKINLHERVEGVFFLGYPFSKKGW